MEVAHKNGSTEPDSCNMSIHNHLESSNASFIVEGFWPHNMDLVVSK